MSSSDQLDMETIAFSYDASSDPLPSAQEIVSLLSKLRGDLGGLSGLKSDEDQVVSTLFGELRRLTRLLQRVPVESSVLPVELGEVERAHVTSEGKLVVHHSDGNMGSIDLSEVGNRDILVDVVRDLAPKLRDILEKPQKLKEPSKEELAPEPEPVVEEPVMEEAFVEEVPLLEEEVVSEMAVEEEPVIEETEKTDDQMTEIASQPPKIEVPPTLAPEPIEKELETYPDEKHRLEPRKLEPKGRSADMLWAVLRGQRGDSLQEILEYRAKIEEEEKKLLEDLKAKKSLKLDEGDGLIYRLKQVFLRSRKKKT